FDEIKTLIERKEAIQRASLQFSEQRGRVRCLGRAKQRTCLLARADAIPEQVRFERFEKRTFEESLDLVLEADLVAGDREERACACQRGVWKRSRHEAQQPRICVGLIVLVAAKQFVRALAAERYRDMPARHSG